MVEATTVVRPSPAGGSNPVRPDARGIATVTAGLAAVACLTLAAEALVLLLLLQGWIDPLPAAVLHVAIVTALTFWVWRLSRRGADCGPALLLTVATLIVGILAPLGVLAVGMLTRRGRQSDQLLKTWYERISLSTEINPVSRLAEKVAIGRTIDLGAPAPRAFADVLQDGTMHEKQTVLGLIARNFHPDHLPSLQLALTSPEPLIRVQAAAVAAHIRAPLNARISAALDEASNPSTPVVDALRIAGEADIAVASGLIDEGSRLRVSSMAAQTRARALAAIDHAALAHPNGAAGLALAPSVLDAYETLLLQARRFDEFRRLRSRQRRPMYGRFVFRRARWSARARMMAVVRPIAGTAS